MKYIFCITQDCNLRCKYCYVDKSKKRMSMSVAKKAIDFMYSMRPDNKKIDVGFFGGEPLLEFERLNEIVRAIEEHDSYDSSCIEYSLVSNGTIYNENIADFIDAHNIGFGISCDGPPWLHDLARRYRNDRGSGNKVEQNIRLALIRFPRLMVNAVYRPETIDYLPEIVDYFSSLGLTQIYLNPDFSAAWTERDTSKLTKIYSRVRKRYVDAYTEGKPIYISLIDSKITVILRGGYQPIERCSMGKGEMAITSTGNIFPCERLIGSGEENAHCIGNVETGIELERMSCRTASSVNNECMTCGLRDYCTNTCGCSNYFSSGFYNRTAPFLCASEKASIVSAYHAIEEVEKYVGSVFSDHVAGKPAMNTVDTI